MQQVSIIGLGLIGGSIGLALKQRRSEKGAPSPTLIGYDLDPHRRELAAQRQVVDQVSAHLAQAVREAQIIIIATPVLAIRQVFAELAPLIHGEATITDTASTKAAVLRWARELLPDGARFIGGHPMAGSTGSLEEARPDLFSGATCCLVPTLRADEDARVDAAALSTLHDIFTTIGAKPLLIDAETHDRCVAAISHLPFLTSGALVETLAGNADIEMMSRLASSGFRDATRLAAGDPAMYHSIALTNREAITRWLDAYIERLQAIRQTLQAAQDGGDEQLLHLFSRARQHRQEMLGLKESWKESG